MTVRVADRTLSFGQRADVRGRARGVGAGGAVVVQQRPAGSRAWLTAGLGRTTAGGRFRVRAALRGAADVRVVAAPAASGAQASRPPPSAPGPPSPRPRTSASSPTSSPAAGASTSAPGGRASVRGVVRPAVAGQAVALQHRTARGWRTVDRGRTGAKGAFRLQARLGQALSAAVRVRVDGAGALAPAGEVVGRLNVFRPALVSWYGPGFYGQRLGCGGTLRAGQLGVAQQVAAVRHDGHAAPRPPLGPRAGHRPRALRRRPRVRPDRGHEGPPRLRRGRVDPRHALAPGAPADARRPAWRPAGDVRSVRVPPGPAPAKRVVAHLDCDAFYATRRAAAPARAARQAGHRRGLRAARVVTTACYEARRFGVGSAMPASRRGGCARRPSSSRPTSRPTARPRARSGRSCATHARARPAARPRRGLPRPHRRRRSRCACCASSSPRSRSAPGMQLSVGIGPNRLVAKVAAATPASPRASSCWAREQACARFAARAAAPRARDRPEDGGAPGGASGIATLGDARSAPTPSVLWRPLRRAPRARSCMRRARFTTSSRGRARARG